MRDGGFRHEKRPESAIFHLEPKNYEKISKKFSSYKLRAINILSRNMRKSAKISRKKFRKYLVSSEKSRNFASQSRETRELPAKRLQNAKIAQLVEHNLAKVGVAGSSPVFRSKSERIREHNEIDKR